MYIYIYIYTHTLTDTHTVTVFTVLSSRAIYFKLFKHDLIIIDPPPPQLSTPMMCDGVVE